MIFAPSEFLHPGPQLDLPRPGAAGLMDEMHVAAGDRVGIERAVRTVARVRPVRAPDAAVDHDMRHMNALRRKLARHALRPPADFFDEPIEVAGGARSERHVDPVFGQRPCERGAQPGPYAHDERGIEFDIRHGEIRFVSLDARDETSTAGWSDGALSDRAR